MKDPVSTMYTIWDNWPRRSHGCAHLVAKLCTLTSCKIKPDESVYGKFTEELIQTTRILSDTFTAPEHRNRLHGGAIDNRTDAVDRNRVCDWTFILTADMSFLLNTKRWTKESDMSLRLLKAATRCVLRLGNAYLWPSNESIGTRIKAALNSSNVPGCYVGLAVVSLRLILAQLLVLAIDEHGPCLLSKASTTDTKISIRRGLHVYAFAHYALYQRLTSKTLDSSLCTDMWLKHATYAIPRTNIKLPLLANMEPQIRANLSSNDHMNIMPLLIRSADWYQAQSRAGLHTLHLETTCSGKDAVILLNLLRKTIGQRCQMRELSNMISTKCKENEIVAGCINSWTFETLLGTHNFDDTVASAYSVHGRYLLWKEEELMKHCSTSNCNGWGTLLSEALSTLSVHSFWVAVLKDALKFYAFQDALLQKIVTDKEEWRRASLNVSNWLSEFRNRLFQVLWDTERGLKTTTLQHPIRNAVCRFVTAFSNSESVLKIMCTKTHLRLDVESVWINGTQIQKCLNSYETHEWPVALDRVIWLWREMGPSKSTVDSVGISSQIDQSASKLLSIAIPCAIALRLSLQNWLIAKRDEVYVSGYQIDILEMYKSACEYMKCRPALQRAILTYVMRTVVTSTSLVQLWSGDNYGDMWRTYTIFTAMDYVFSVRTLPCKRVQNRTRSSSVAAVWCTFCLSCPSNVCLKSDHYDGEANVVLLGSAKKTIPCGSGSLFYPTRGSDVAMCMQSSALLCVHWKKCVRQKRDHITQQIQQQCLNAETGGGLSARSTYSVALATYMQVITCETVSARSIDLRDKVLFLREQVIRPCANCERLIRYTTYAHAIAEATLCHNCYQMLHMSQAKRGHIACEYCNSSWPSDPAIPKGTGAKKPQHKRRVKQKPFTFVWCVDNGSSPPRFKHLSFCKSHAPRKTANLKYYSEIMKMVHRYNLSRNNFRR